MTSSADSAAVSLISIILNSELARWIAAELIHGWRSMRWQGTYKVLEYRTTLELHDKNGRSALATKRQHVEFVQDGVFAIQDQAWGDGDIFDDYRCSPGVAVDRHIESYRWKVLISLRSTKNRGEKEEFLIERRIKNGFTAPIDFFQALIDHPTKNLTVEVIFPKSRPPRTVCVIEENTRRSYMLDHSHRKILPDGRTRFTWQIARPRLFEAYILKWEW